MPVAKDDLANVGPLAKLLTVHLRRADIRLSQVFFSQRKDVKGPAFVALSIISTNPGISQNDLARMINMDASIVVGIINQLEALGWAVRERSTDDRRRHALAATEEGRAELEAAAELIQRAEERLLSKMSKEEIEFLRYLLDRVHDSCISNRDPAENEDWTRF
jgi:DNA-binding MarR family transcriptional regulator